MFISSVFEKAIEGFRREPSILDPLRIGVNMDIMSIVEDAEDSNEIDERFDEWVATVRDPALKSTEGVRTIGSRKLKVEANYEIAPLPDGSFAVTFDFSYHCGNCHGHSIPWMEYETRDQCVEAFLDAARQHFDQPIHSSQYQEEGDGLKSQRQTQATMQGLLAGNGLFGFMEPEPVKIEEDPGEG